MMVFILSVISTAAAGDSAGVADTGSSIKNNVADEYVLTTDNISFEDKSVNSETATGKNSMAKKTIKKDTADNTGSDTGNTLDSRVIPDLRVNNNPITPGENTTFTAIINDDATGKGVFKLNGKTISDKINISSSIVRFNYTIPENFKNPTYTLTFQYSGDQKYQNISSSAAIKLNIIEKDLDPKLSLKSVSIKYLSNGTITLTMDKNATGTVVFKINKTTVTPKLKVKNGTVSYQMNATLTPGKYKLEAPYSGSVKFKNATASSYLYIEKLSTKITQENIISKAGTRINLKTYLEDELGRPVKFALIVYKINGVTIGNTTTNSKGYTNYMYTLPHTFDDKKYTLNIISNATNKTLISKENVTITLGQLKTNLKISKITAKINETIVITASPTDENKNLANQGSVLFKINGKTQKLVPLVNGLAVFTYKPTTNVARNYSIEAAYKGTWKYTDSSGTSTIEMIKIGTITTARYADAKAGMKTTISARVEDKNQVLVNGGIVVFTVNGTYFGNATVKNGAANYTFTMPRYPQGVYILNATYMGSNSYLGSNNLNYVNVTRLNSRIVTEPVFVTVGNKVNITAYIMDETNHYAENGEVEFKLNGTVIGKAKVKNGTASIIYKPPYKYSGMTLRYIATLKANQFYGEAYTINNITVSSLKEVFVSKNGSDNNIGDKQHPFKTLKFAVGHVSIFGVVYVMNGVYQEAPMLLNRSVTIKGSGYKTTIIDASKTNGEPLFTIAKIDASVTIKSIAIRNGKSTSIRSAGAIKNYGKLNITGVKFDSNQATGNLSAGAIYSSGELNITSSDFINNSVSNPNAESGALRLINNTTVINKVTFSNNNVKGSNSTGGGAIYMNDGVLLVTSSTFNSNKATGLTALGGAIKGISGEMILTSVNMKNNFVNGTTFGIGGAINSLGTSIYLNLSTFNSNKAYGKVSSGAGAMYSQYAVVMSYNNVFQSNIAESQSVIGGAVEGYFSYSNFVNSTFKQNKAISTNSTAYGGVIYYDTGNLTLSSCKFLENEAISNNLSIGGAIYTHANTTIYHCDFNKTKLTAKNLGGGAIANLGNLTVSQTNFVLNNASTSGDDITSTTESKNIIENNYWYAQNPKWNEKLRGVTRPKNYSKTPIKH